jgi:hypothetical protein
VGDLHAVRRVGAGASLMGKAKEWVDANFPAAAGERKVELILAYGAGLDAGLGEAQEFVSQLRSGIADDGVVYTPLITDSAKFDRRTAELRAAGFAREADSRDRFAGRT